jgi:hypothetical protein
MFFWKVEPAPLSSPVAQAVELEALAAEVGPLAVPPCESVPQAERANVPAAASNASFAPRVVLNVFPSVRPCRLPAGLVTDGRQPTWTRGAARVNHG